jgi:hypothetical protein
VDAGSQQEVREDEAEEKAPCVTSASRDPDRKRDRVRRLDRRSRRARPGGLGREQLGEDPIIQCRGDERIVECNDEQLVQRLESDVDVRFDDDHHPRELNRWARFLGT